MMRKIQLPGRQEEDEGFSLIELLVSIMLFSVVISVFIGATNAMFSGLRKEQGVADAAIGTRKAYLLLEKQVRYATGINTPAAGTDGKWYVEWEGPNTDGDVECDQWRVDGVADRLEMRTGIKSGTAFTMGSWTVIATGVTNSLTATPKPFELAPSSVGGQTLTHQRLSINITSQRGKPSPGKSSLSTTFTALNTINSAALTSATAVCSGVSRS